MIRPYDLLLKDRLVIDLVVEQDSRTAKMVHRKHRTVFAVGWLTRIYYLNLFDFTLTLCVVAVVLTHMQSNLLRVELHKARTARKLSVDQPNLCFFQYKSELVLQSWSLLDILVGFL